MNRTLAAILCLAPLAASAQTPTPTTWVPPVHTTEDEHFAKRRQAAVAFSAPAEKVDPEVIKLLIQQQTSMLQMHLTELQILQTLQEIKGAATPR